MDHVTVPTGLTYPDLVSAFEREVPRWNPMAVLERLASWREITEEIERIAPPHGLVMPHRVNHGAVTSLAGSVKRCAFYLVGNPLVAERILAADIRASLSLPLRVALYDEGGPSGACIAYERPSATLGELGEALDRQLASVASSCCAVTSREISLVRVPVPWQE